MSHLSILPTVFTRLDLLAQSLQLEGFTLEPRGALPVFGSEPRLLDLLASFNGSRPVGWQQQRDGSILMHGDLQRLSVQIGLSERLQRVSRRYALLESLEHVDNLVGMGAKVTVKPC